MARTNTIPVVFADLRGGRNGSDPPLSLPSDQVVEALNVDYDDGTLARKRGGSATVATTFSAGGPFTGTIAALVRHVPGTDEGAAELWAFDSAATPIVGRMAGAATFAAPTVVDSISGTVHDLTGISYAGMLFLGYSRSSLNRLHVWDPAHSKVRRAGLATPDPPTGATLGGSGLSFTRYYRIRTYDNTTAGKRRSEASTSISVTISDDSGVRITRPTLPTDENETHWEVEYADASAGPWYRAAQVATGTSTYDDTASTISTTNLTDEAGIHWPPPSAKFFVKDSARLLMAGCWETSGGYTSASNRRVWWTPPFGALDVGDAERIPNRNTGAFGVEYGIDVEEAITGLGGPVNGNVFVFAYKSIWVLVPTTLPGANAYRRYTLRRDIGCIRQHTIVTAEDENGNEALYFLSHRGPYRIGANGIQYLGNDIEDIWANINLGATTCAAFGVHYADKHQVWWWLALGGNNEPAGEKIVFDTRLGKFVPGTGKGDSVLKGWTHHNGNSASARCAVMFSNTLGATMSRDLKPYIGQNAAANRLWKCEQGTDDQGTNFQAYIDTKPITADGEDANLSTTDPTLIAKAATGVTITVTPLSDFGLETTQAGTCLLTAAGSETRVIKRVEGLQAAGKGAIAFRIGDGSAASNGWVLDVLRAKVSVQEPRA